MPTVILLDVSLSMCRTVRSSANKDGNENLEVKHLANVGIECLLDYFAQNSQLEYTSLIVYSSLWEIRHPFSRHHESVKNGIYDLELYDKSNIINALRGVLSLKLHDWVQNGPINIILITDGQLSDEIETDEDEDIYQDPKANTPSDFYDIPLFVIEDGFTFPCKIQVICLTSSKEPALKESLPFYKKLISVVDHTSKECPVIIGPQVKNFKQSAIWLPESDESGISVESVERLFSRLADLHYKPHHTTLTCGHLSSLVMISPSPTECLLEPLKNEFDDLKCEQSLGPREDMKETFVSAMNKVRLYKLNDEINICGFMPLAEIVSPAVTSRHIVLPIYNSKFNEISRAEQILSQDPNAYNKARQTGLLDGLLNSAKHQVDKLKSQENEAQKLTKLSTAGSDNSTTTAASTTTTTSTIEPDITKQPSFCTLLHNGLKQEAMVAICMIGKNEETNDEWFGMLHSYTDSKKRSSLMLSLFIPGPNPILWLPNFKSLGSSLLNADLPQAIRDKIANSRGPVKSYSSNSVIWLDPESVQADVQKIVRHAKRSPDKAPHFYRELNRIRRAAISYGFYDVLFGLAAILEREKRIMKLEENKGANQELLGHIDHVIACLREGLTEESYDSTITPIAMT